MKYLGNSCAHRFLKKTKKKTHKQQKTNSVYNAFETAANNIICALKAGTKPLTTRMSLGITAEMEKSINSELDGITTYIWLKQSSPMDCTDF